MIVSGNLEELDLVIRGQQYVRRGIDLENRSRHGLLDRALQ